MIDLSLVMETTRLTSSAIAKLERLCQALEEYERDRWRIVSQKVGNGFSATACKDKANELNEGPVERCDFDVEENGHLQS